MIENKIIIFGPNLINSLGLIRSFGEKGIKPILILEPCNPLLGIVQYSKYIEKIHYLKKIEDVIDVLKKYYWTEKKKPIILCGGDTSIALLDKYYDELNEHFFFFNAGDKGRIGYYLNKANTFPLAEQSEFSIIRTWTIANVSNLPQNITFPCIIKGNNSTHCSKGDMVICQNYDELKEHLHEGIEYLIQEYIEKDYELDIVGISYNHGQDVYAPAAVRKIRESLTRQSDYICLEEIKKYESLYGFSINSLLASIGYEGLFSVEVMCKDNKAYFLEINLRNDGTCYLYTAAGCNLPYIWALYCSEKLDDELLAQMTPKTPYTLMQLNDVTNVLARKVNLVTWVKQALGANAHFLWNKHDVKPFFYDCLVHIRQAIRKIKRII